MSDDSRGRLVDPLGTFVVVASMLAVVLLAVGPLSRWVGSLAAEAVVGLGPCADLSATGEARLACLLLGRPAAP